MLSRKASQDASHVEVGELARRAGGIQECGVQRFIQDAVLILCFRTSDSMTGRRLQASALTRHRRAQASKCASHHWQARSRKSYCNSFPPHLFLPKHQMGSSCHQWFRVEVLMERLWESARREELERDRGAGVCQECAAVSCCYMVNVRPNANVLLAAPNPLMSGRTFRQAGAFQTDHYLKLITPQDYSMSPVNSTY